MTHVPPPTIVTVAPWIVQTFEDEVEKVTVNPESLVAEMATGESPNVAEAMLPKVIVCGLFPVSADEVVAAALPFPYAPPEIEAMTYTVY